MCIYDVYSKAPIKCRELEEVCESKSFLDSSEFPIGGNRLVVQVLFVIKYIPLSRYWTDLEHI